MRSAFLSVAMFMLIPLWTVSSQGVQPKRGDRIRVTVPSLGVKPFVGIVERVPADTILVRTGAEVLSAFPLDQVARLELSRGTRSPTWALFAPLWMPLAGGAVGFALGAAKPGSREDPATAGLIIGVMGAVVGLVAGVVTVFVVDLRDEWETVPTGRGSRTSLAPSLHVAPSTRGLRLGLRAGF